MTDIRTIGDREKNNLKITFVTRPKRPRRSVAQKEGAAAAGFLNVINGIADAADEDDIALVKLTVVKLGEVTLSTTPTSPPLAFEYVVFPNALVSSSRSNIVAIVHSAHRSK